MNKERFLVYCYNFTIQDYTLSWGYDPRFVKNSFVTKLVFDDGSQFVATADHQVLTAEGKWKKVEQLAVQEKLMAFYRIPANTKLTKQKHRQFPRINKCPLN